MRLEPPASSFLDVKGVAPRYAGPLALMLAVAILSAFAVLTPADDIGRPAAAILASALSLVSAAMLVRNHVIAQRRERRLRQSEAERAWQMSCCSATGALLRRSFLEACETRIRAASPDAPLAYLAVDMDHLKTINDGLGHDVGDAALRCLVQCIERAAGPEAVVGRLGGDEFAFLVPCPDEAHAKALADRFLRDLRHAMTLGSRELTLSATVGIVLLPGDTAFLSEALQFSDLALYAGKNEGRSRATGFNASMLYELRRSQQIERELRLALHRDELAQRYRPVVDSDGLVMSVRAGLEWTNPWLGAVPLATFMGIAEKTNLIDHVGEWSFRRACFDAMALDGDLSVSVAVSCQQLKRDAVVDMIAKAVADSGIAPRRIVAVISQATTLSANADVENRLRRLRAIGIRISLDDIGAILCDFERLRRFPVDLVRIPEGHIARLGQSEADNVAVTALASIGRAMNLLVVAEGVSDRRQMMLARTAGCDRFSGPLFAEAADVSGINEWIAAQSPARWQALSRTV